MARTIQDYQRDSMEEKEVYKSMKNNKEKITRKERTVRKQMSNKEKRYRVGKRT